MAYREGFNFFVNFSFENLKLKKSYLNISNKIVKEKKFDIKII
jgi:hypothetical protein